MAIPQTPRSYDARGVHRERFDAVQSYAGQSVLDVGCGNGAYVRALRDSRTAMGCDLQPSPLWADEPELFRTADACNLPWPDESFESILSFEVLEHVPDAARALREFWRVSRKNIIVSVPNCNITKGMDSSRLVYYHWIDSTHVNFFDLDSFSGLIEESGFRVKQALHINHIDLEPLFREAYNLEGRIGRWVARYLRSKRTGQYPLTCLVVAEKVSNP